MGIYKMKKSTVHNLLIAFIFVPLILIAIAALIVGAAMAGAWITTKFGIGIALIVSAMLLMSICIFFWLENTL